MTSTLPRLVVYFDFRCEAPSNPKYRSAVSKGIELKGTELHVSAAEFRSHRNKPNEEQWIRKKRRVKTHKIQPRL
ncbi:uncharacterized protein V6R79_013662 [Siganus canaliculatus]